MAREFRVIDDISIEFDENVFQWNLTYKELFEIRHGRSLVHFREVNIRVLDLLDDCDLTDEESEIIHKALWLYLFQVER